MRIIPLIIFGFVLSACTAQPSLKLPEPVSNNATAYHQPTDTVYSFAGLYAGKSWRDVTPASYACQLKDRTCTTISPLPDAIGRLAATAQTIGDTIYIFGGYSVGEDGHEISTPEVWAFDTRSQSYIRKTDMPVPVDDSVSLVYQGRYIYLVSGWHKDDNVLNVQLYDSENDTWSPATDWPGVPVFGHSGGIVGGVMIVCDGVQIIPATDNERRQFAPISACWRGDIDPDNRQNIQWRQLSPLPGKGLYRMAATGWADKNMVVFAGGTDNPYNYNGIGYDKNPSAPSAHVWAYDINADTYVVFKDKPLASMDHRALIPVGGNTFLTVGGMGEDQEVLDLIDVFGVD